MTRPNILFLQTDQLAANVLAAYGGTAITPNLDRLAGDGVVFERAYCNYPLCAPSRFSMASGLLASKIGAYDNAAEFPAAIPTYAHYLRALGYQTCLSGKMHFVGPDQLHGFEKRLTPDIYPGDFSWTADWSQDKFDGATDIRMLTASGICARSVQIDYDDLVTYQARQELFDIARADDDRPFFLQVSWTHPHDPYLCRQEHWDLYDPADIPALRTGLMPDEENDPHSIRMLRGHGLHGEKIDEDVIQRARHAYYGSVSYIDDRVGEVLAALSEAGLADNTVIVFGSDHGEMLGERGLWFKKVFFENSVKVPLVICLPGDETPRQVETPVSLLDLAPTLISLADDGQGLDLAEPLDGENLIPMMGGSLRKSDVVSELMSEGLADPVVMIRRDRYKFIGGPSHPNQLFDLQSDPHERNDLADSPDHTEILTDFEERMSARWDFQTLRADIARSQKRRAVIQNAHAQGKPPSWDHPTSTDEDSRWLRGAGDYGDWAFDDLPVAPKPSD